PLYHAMPALIVSANYQGRLRYLQVKLSIMTRNEETLDKLDVNTPLLQDALIMLLNEYPFDKLETPAGKEEFRERSLLRVQEVIADEQVESLLFTGFVIQ
ncbi:MAG: flagellar basal body-associated FliL family protein, partial [Pseudohongiellaceae bacterium]